MVYLKKARVWSSLFLQIDFTVDRMTSLSIEYFKCSMSFTGCVGSTNQPFSLSQYLVGFYLNTDSNDRANTEIISAMRSSVKNEGFAIPIYIVVVQNQYSTLKRDSHLLMELFLMCFKSEAMIFNRCSECE